MKKRRISQNSMITVTWFASLLVGAGAALLSFVCPQVVLAADSEIFFVRTAEQPEAVIDRELTHDYELSPIRWLADGTEVIDVWYCSGIVNQDHNFHVRLDSEGNRISEYSMAVAPSSPAHPLAPDSKHACHPSVVRHGAEGIVYQGVELGPGEELYYMYYECGPKVWNRTAPDPRRPLVSVGGRLRDLLRSHCRGSAWRRAWTVRSG